MSGHSEIVRLLLQHGADINFKDKIRRTALHVASTHNVIGVVEELLKKSHCVSLDLNALDIRGDTSLHNASLYNCVDVLKFLINQGANIHALNNDGQTPLHKGVSCNHTLCVELLLSNGADIFIIDNKGRLPKDMTSSLDMIKFLEQYEVHIKEPGEN